MAESSNPVVPVLFKGGQLGGETEMLEYRLVHIPYRVPVTPRRFYVGKYAELSLPTVYEYDVEEYRWEGERGNGGVFIMRWQNPVWDLKAKVKELEDKLAEVRRILNGRAK